MTTPCTGPRYSDLLARLAHARAAGMALGLDAMQAVLARLDHPERRAVTVHIAGTNGKGSTAAMTESILRAAGLRTGLYTSPHLSRFTERIRIDGREIDGDRLAQLDGAIAATGIPLTYFELATALGFVAFADAGVDVAVLEVGLGGRLDATTVCAPVGTAITSVGLDHTELLGETLAEIAREKAGIAKPGVPLFLAAVPPEADAAIAAVAVAVGAPVLRLGREIAAAPAAPGLAGAHQISNAGLAVALARAAARACGRALTEDAIARGLSGVEWPGRLERIARDVLLDAAHNVEGIAALGCALDGLPRQRRALVISIVAGKAAGPMLAELLPRFDAAVVTRSSSDRALPVDTLAALLRAEAPPDLVITTRADPVAALADARAAVGPGGLVVATGSVFLIGDLRAAMASETRDELPTSDPLSPSPQEASSPAYRTKPAR